MFVLNTFVHGRNIQPASKELPYVLRRYRGTQRRTFCDEFNTYTCANRTSVISVEQDHAYCRITNLPENVCSEHFPFETVATADIL